MLWPRRGSRTVKPASTCEFVLATQSHGVLAVLITNLNVT
jgi:hypothetical protein